MKIEKIEKLCEDSMDEYDKGYDKSYKNIPYLVAKLRKLLEENKRLENKQDDYILKQITIYEERIKILESRITELEKENRELVYGLSAED